MVAKPLIGITLLCFCLPANGLINSKIHSRLSSPEKIVFPRPSSAVASSWKGGKAWNRRLHMTATVIGASDDESNANKKQSVRAASFSLVKAIVGSGILALPSGVAAMGSSKNALPPSIFLLVTLAGLSGYCFHMLGRLCHDLRAKTLGEAWELRRGSESAWVVSLATLIFCLGSCLSYSIMLGDTLTCLADGIGLNTAIFTRQLLIVGCTLTTLVPLCSLPNLAALAPFSVVGVIGAFLTIAFMGFQCPAVRPASPYPLPLFPPGRKRVWASPSSMVLTSMAATCYMGHFSAPEFYHSLEEKDAMRNYGKLTIAGFSMVTLLYMAAVTFGFLTFGGNCSSIILNNYSTNDLGASICRIFMAVSVIGGYPMLMSACRSAFLELFPKAGRRRTTYGLLGVITAAALVLKDAGFVVSFNGALMGSGIIYILPPILFLSKAGGSRLEKWLNRFLIVFGALCGVVGATMSIRTYFPGR